MGRLTSRPLYWVREILRESIEKLIFEEKAVAIRRECLVLEATSHIHHHIGTEKSQCFYFQPMGLSQVAKKYGGRFVGRAARIEVTDTEDDLHQHAGATIVFITSGEGFFKMKRSTKKVTAGDVIYVPPMTPHLSIAQKGMVMVESVVYLGDIADMQESLPVPKGEVTNPLHLKVLEAGLTRATFFNALARYCSTLKHHYVYAWLDERSPKRPSPCYRSAITKVLEISEAELKELIY